MSSRLALIPITGLVLFTLVGCSAASNGSGTNNRANIVSNSMGSTNKIASNSGNTANSVEVSVGKTTPSQSNYGNEIALIQSKGYTVNGTTPNATVKTSSGETLSGWLGVAGGDAHNQFVFFFLNGKYLGTDTAKPSVEITSARVAGTGIAVTYPVYKETGFFARPSGTPVTITYSWNGSKLVPNKPYPKQFKASNTTTQAQTPIPKVLETLYKDSSAAANVISQIQKSTYLTFTSNNPLENLGLGISAKQEGALGHAGLQWKEGNWVIEVLWNGENQGGTQLAKKIVAYLHVHRLPAPNQHGIIIVQSTDPNSKQIKASTIIAWQEGNKVYHLEQNGDPVQVLGVLANTNFQ